MSTSAKTSAAPAQFKDTPLDHDVFEWYENKIQEGLQTLYLHDVGQRQILVETIREMKDSNLFWGLFSRYGDAVDEAGDDENKKMAAMMALLARVYVAGTLRGHGLLEI